MSFIEIEYRKTDKEWNMADLQAHNFYEIYYLLKGERHIFIEDKIFTLHENSIVIIPPFYMHKTEGGPYERVNVYLSNDLLDENERKFLYSRLKGARGNTADDRKAELRGKLRILSRQRRGVPFHGE